MSFEAIAPAVRGEASAPKWSRFLPVFDRADADRPLAGADGSVHMLLRAFAIATALAFALVAALLSMPDGWGRFRLSEASRAGARSRPAPPPLFFLTNRGLTDQPLDADAAEAIGEAVKAWSGSADAEADKNVAGAAPMVLQFGPVRVARAIVEHVVQAARTTGSDPALLMAIADKESSFAPKAKASTSSASGLFQFIDSTWLKAVRMFGRSHGQEAAAQAIGGDYRVAPQKRSEILAMRNDPYLSAVFAAEMLKHDGERIAERIGRPLTAGETYLIHFLGPDDAARFMAKVEEAPNTPAAKLLPRPARANKPIFFAREGKKMKPKSVGEVHEAFETMMGKRSDRYKGVERQLPAAALAYTE
ncbi:lytic transglycosylase domain-containing protein [Methylosinus sporium]|uniref:Lytic transglycosylase domain-containing protein n=2 Tax=Methylosinus sporium TaxID=428 RepID=A0A549SU03_METSR|nr:lytic transglycosylase domain-containing protein [Methylosinus sporium]